MQINNDLLPLIRQSVQVVWEAIASDASEFCNANEDAVEMCIDANRPSTFDVVNGIKCEAAIKALIKEHGYKPVLRHLSSKISLM